MLPWRRTRRRNVCRDDAVESVDEIWIQRLTTLPVLWEVSSISELKSCSSGNLQRKRLCWGAIAGPRIVERNQVAKYLWSGEDQNASPKKRLSLGYPMKWSGVSFHMRLMRLKLNQNFKKIFSGKLYDKWQFVKKVIINRSNFPFFDWFILR